MNRQGFTLMEMMTASAVFSIMAAGMYFMLASGQAAWWTTDAQAELQQNLRQTLERVSKELRETSDVKVSVSEAAGVNNSDILKFYMPILCQAGMNVMDSSGNVAYWGAPFTWGCTDVSCMDTDGKCSTLDNYALQYQINSQNQFLRRVVNSGGSVVKEAVFASDIVDFQIVRTTNMVNLTITAQRKTNLNRVLNTTMQLDIRLRN